MAVTQPLNQNEALFSTRGQDRAVDLYWATRSFILYEVRIEGVDLHHTPSTVFRHLPLNSARFGYATEGALFISAQLSTDAVSALQKVWVLIWLWMQHSAKART